MTCRLLVLACVCNSTQLYLLSRSSSSLQAFSFAVLDRKRLLQFHRAIVIHCTRSLHAFIARSLHAFIARLSHMFTARVHCERFSLQTLPASSDLGMEVQYNSTDMFCKLSQPGKSSCLQMPRKPLRRLGLLLIRRAFGIGDARGIQPASRLGCHHGHAVTAPSGIKV